MVSEQRPKSRILHYLVAAAAVVLVIAGVQAAASIIVPCLLAVILSVIALPAVQWLQQRQVPTAIAIISVLAALAGITAGVIFFVTASLSGLYQNLDTYTKKLRSAEEQVFHLLQPFGFNEPDVQPPGELNNDAAELIPAEDQPDVAPLPSEVTARRETTLSIFDPQLATGLLKQLLNGLLILFGNAFVILFLVGFMLAEVSWFPDKIAAAFGSQHVLPRMGEVFENIWRYLAIKTVISLATGVLVTLLLWSLGVKYALLWGFLAFCFNYIPNVGSVIASIPPTILALLDVGPATAAGVALGYLVINNVLGGVIEPRWQGQGLGLSPLVVFASLLFWGWVLGPVGMLLSAPLTMAVKIACDSHADTRWIAILLGPTIRPQRE